MPPIEQAHVQFSPAGLQVLNIALGFVMFAVSLGIQTDELRRLRDRPRALAAGLFSQWVALPVITVGLVILLIPHPGIALGMLLVAACPGGNMSNYFCQLAKANTALSVGLTTIATLGAALMTPMIFGGAARLLPDLTADVGVSVDWVDMVKTTLLLIALPVALGAALRKVRPLWAQKIEKPAQILAGLVLVAFIVIALVVNRGAFGAYVGHVAGLVALHNGLALLIGYSIAWAARLEEPERRTIAIETGIQNSGLGLVLIFSFFNGNGPMAVVAAWWGVWHLLSGGTLATIWSRRPPLSAQQD
ncbi:MAG: bile acid:sodium symporter family protein [bacterium]